MDLDGEIGKRQNPLVAVSETNRIRGIQQLLCPIHLVADHQDLLVECEFRPPFL
jgi:hypothetical protein